MKSPEVVYLSSFDRNQRLIQEHKVCEEQLQIRDHFSRVLGKVKEGKRKFLRVTALPESSDIPWAIHIDTSLSVTVAFELTDLKFNIMS